MPQGVRVRIPSRVLYGILLIMTVKICNTCGNEKELELFAKGKAYKDGYRNICKRCHTDKMIKYYKDNPQKNREKIRMNSGPGRAPNWLRHKLNKEKFDQLMSLYDGKCHSCKDRDAEVIDHDHSCCDKNRSCGKCVRGILCNKCNMALGLLNDDQSAILNLAKYINLAWPTGKATNC
jgi:hypothetical protein